MKEIVERIVTFLMDPDSGDWSYAGANKALEKLSQKFEVEINSEILSHGDFGHGLEETYALAGREADINALIEEFEEYASQLSLSKEEVKEILKEMANETQEKRS